MTLRRLTINNMKKIVSLIKKEWHTNKLWWIFIVLFGFVFIWLLPPLIGHFSKSTLNSQEMRNLNLFITFISLLLIPIIQLHVSLHRDIKQKDIWLHNPSSIFTLIGAKWLFVLLALIITSFLLFSGFFFLGNYIIGKWWQIVLLISVLTFLETVFYVAFSMLSLLFYALYLQVKRYIGRFSLFVVFAITILFVWLLGKLPENFLEFPYGKIPTDWIFTNLPTFTSSSIEITYDIHFNLYFTNFIVDILLFIICFTGSSKWIEKVITR